jgi:dTDP-4-amino-4,6-dideoxygalactose transaminase
MRMQQARPVWKPMHTQPVFEAPERKAHGGGRTGKAKYQARVVGGHVAEDLFNRGLCLPSGTAMTEQDLDRIISGIVECKR